LKRNDLRHHPLIFMSQAETEDVLFSGDMDEPLLEARQGPATDVVLVGAILRLSNGEERVVIQGFRVRRRCSLDFNKA
jgi:hypothetical protein